MIEQGSANFMLTSRKMEAIKKPRISGLVLNIIPLWS